MTLIGRTLGKFHIVEYLGSGGMAEVYRAYHPDLDRYVAIKVLHAFLADEENFLTRFQREARFVATFRHPNIVQVHDFDHDPKTNAYYIVMEFLDGPTLKTRLQELSKEDRRLPLEEAVHIVTAVANALDYAHQQGMVHRDIKPANIILTRGEQVILSDFGIARMINTSTLTASGATLGTPAYMAPEQGMGHTGDERSDIYSLGAVFYQLVTGNLPFEADTPFGTVLKHINSPLTPPSDIVPDLSPNIEAVIIRTLAKDPNHRYQTAREFITDLEKAMTGKPIERLATESAIAPVAAETTITSGTQDQPKELEASFLSARPAWRWIIVLAGALIITLVSSIALFVSGASDRLQAALFPPKTIPTADVMNTTTLPSTHDLTPTFDFLSTQVAAGVDAALATRDALAIYEATVNARTPALTPSPTPDLTATAFAACKLDMEVVNDYEVQPDPVPPGDLLVKRWTVRNTGTCAWPSGVQLCFEAGEELEITSGSEIKPIPPAEIGEIEITLSAPIRPDRYTSMWRLRDDQGNPIGDELTVAFQVGLRSTATPTPIPTPEPTPIARESLWMSIPGITWCDSGKAGGRVEWGGGGGPSDEYRYFQGGVSLKNELSGPYNEFVGFPHVATYFTTSGELAFPIPDGCCPGDYGSYVSPDGYEIVWQKVWVPAGNCPD
jgi:serine/threonine protein kinase